MSTPGDGGAGQQGTGAPAGTGQQNGQQGTGAPAGTGQQNGQAAPPADDTAAKLAALAKTAKDANTEAASLRQRLADAEKAAQEARDASDTTRTQAQKDADKRTQLEARATAAETELTRFRVAAAAGLPLEHAGRIRGATETEMAADAKDLATLLGAAVQQGQQSAAAQQTAQRQAPDPSQGNGGQGPGALNGDPLLASLEAAVGIRRS